MANLATKAAVEGRGRFRIHAPLIQMTKAQIIQTGTVLGLDYGITHSCYDPSPEGKACGSCDSCILRKNGFADAGVTDPTPYIDR
jgi:7-cyano-7-deazaguanine synthase